MKKIGIIGAGASGLYALSNIKDENLDITIFEKNEAIGRKILMTGNGRCNITNAKIYNDFLDNIVTNKKFIYSSFNLHDNYQTMGFFEDSGLSLVTEENDRVFPASGKAADVVKFFEDEIIKANAKLITGADVSSIKKEDKFIVEANERTYEFDKLIIATGGLSYSNTGSTGDGYKFAKDFGHRVTKTIPSLVPIFFKDKDLIKIKALSLEGIEITAKTNSKTIKEYGPLLITSNFISGPTVLSLSSKIGDEYITSLSLDLTYLSREELDDEILALIDENSNKDISNILKDLLANALIEVVLNRAKIELSKKANQLTKDERHRIIQSIKNFSLEFDHMGGFNTAVITKGGVDVDEINPKTMESKLVEGLYFIGEVLDIDGLTGGFNLQLAFTTAYAAASAIKETI